MTTTKGKTGAKVNQPAKTLDTTASGGAEVVALPSPSERPGIARGPQRGEKTARVRFGQAAFAEAMAKAIPGATTEGTILVCPDMPRAEYEAVYAKVHAGFEGQGSPLIVCQCGNEDPDVFRLAGDVPEWVSLGIECQYCGQCDVLHVRLEDLAHGILSGTLVNRQFRQHGRAGARA